MINKPFLEEGGGKGMNKGRVEEEEEELVDYDGLREEMNLNGRDKQLNSVQKKQQRIEQENAEMEQMDRMAQMEGQEQEDDEQEGDEDDDLPFEFQRVFVEELNQELLMDPNGNLFDMDGNFLGQAAGDGEEGDDDDILQEGEEDMDMFFDDQVQANPLFEKMLQQQKRSKEI